MAGFIDARTTTKAFVFCVEARRVEYIKRTCSLGCYSLNPVRLQLDRAAFLLRSHEKKKKFVYVDFRKFSFIMFHYHINKKYYHEERKDNLFSKAVFPRF